MYTLIAWYKDAIFFTKWCICDIYYLCQHRAMAAISVCNFICNLHCKYEVAKTILSVSIVLWISVIEYFFLYTAHII